MGLHRLGFAVKVLGGGGLPSHDTRRWQSGPHLGVSLDRLAAVFDRLDGEDIRMYRMASALVPYATHPALPSFHDQVSRCAARLAETGARARRLAIRLSFHPGQYTVLNSERADVRAAAVRDVELHAEVLDAMGAGPEAVVVLHLGAGTGGRDAALERFLAGFDALSERARRRLAVENDDRVFSVADALAVARRTGVPVVWDALHHHCHDPDRIPDGEALRMALATWPAGVVPKIHYSSPRTAVGERRRRVGRRVEREVLMPPLRAHADLLDPIGFEQFLTGPAAGLDFDVMLEAKAKDLALLRLRDQLLARGFAWEAGRLRSAAVSPLEAAGTGRPPSQASRARGGAK